MRRAITDATLCDVCGDELGMDSGHHVDYGRLDGRPCHWRCIAEIYRAQVLDATRQRDEAVAALRQLVALKDEKDQHGKTIAYTTFQPLAWENARRALANCGTSAAASGTNQTKEEG